METSPDLKGAKSMDEMHSIVQIAPFGLRFSVVVLLTGMCLIKAPKSRRWTCPDKSINPSGLDVWKWNLIFSWQRSSVTLCKKTTPFVSAVLANTAAPINLRCSLDLHKLWAWCYLFLVIHGPPRWQLALTLQRRPRLNSHLLWVPIQRHSHWWDTPQQLFTPGNGGPC